MTKVSENHEGNNANTLLAVVYCYQVHYMNKDIHKFILIEWTDEYVKFKWKQDGKWHRATKYFNAINSNERWFKTEIEAIEFVSNDYDTVFLNNS